MLVNVCIVEASVAALVCGHTEEQVPGEPSSPSSSLVAAASCLGFLLKMPFRQELGPYCNKNSGFEVEVVRCRQARCSPWTGELLYLQAQ